MRKAWRQKTVGALILAVAMLVSAGFAQAQNTASVTGHGRSLSVGPLTRFIPGYGTAQIAPRVSVSGAFGWTGFQSDGLESELWRVGFECYWRFSNRWTAFGFSALGLSNDEILARDFIVCVALYADCPRQMKTIP